jgi:NAD(P)-dependent dehydrogenase (short-subunit alcohol dehydrogenase family)
MSGAQQGSRLSGKVAIVTGGTQGIGAATVRRFAAEGAVVVFGGRQAALGEALAAEVSGACFVQGDVTQREDLQRLVDTAQAAGGVDVLVNNAGVGYMSLLQDLTDEAWDRALDINLRAAMRLSRLVVPLMLARGGGSIINIASLAAVMGGPKYAAYSASKAGLCGLTRALAGELGRPGIRVNAILPGAIETEMFATEVDAHQKAWLETMTPLGRVGQPDEIARMALFLASGEASFVTGQSIAVDGGVMMR